ncbi:MAG: methyltransferase domain-containing protein, partial [Terriglobales bacterium]
MLLQPIVDNQADVVFGSRMMTMFGALKGGMPLYKYVGNRILTACQNTVLGSSLSEFHTGYRIYSTGALKRVPFQFNTGDFHFDTEIIIQMLLAKQRITELPIPTFYGDEVCHVDGMKYAWDVAVTTTVAKLQSFELQYRRNFDIDRAFSKHAHYEPKLDYDSSDTRALNLIPAGSTVVDMGCTAYHLCSSLQAKNCTVIGVGRLPDDGKPSTYDCYYPHDLTNGNLPLNFEHVDYILMLDVIEHQNSPEDLVAEIARACGTSRRTKLIVTTGNVAFLITRLMLLLGQFNYGKRGILDLTHTRLFTFPSLRFLFESNGFETLDTQGIPAPFPLAIKNKGLSSSLLKMNSALINLRKRLFSYQMLFVLRPW